MAVFAGKDDATAGPGMPPSYQLFRTAGIGL